MMKRPDHPGTVTFVDLSRGTRREAPLSEIPEDKRYVYLRDGLAVQNPTEATECVPVVLVEMMALDEGGQLVAPETATSVQITEFGPERRPLRHTHMVRA